MPDYIGSSWAVVVNLPATATLQDHCTVPLNCSQLTERRASETTAIYGIELVLTTAVLHANRARTIDDTRRPNVYSDRVRQTN